MTPQPSPIYDTTYRNPHPFPHPVRGGEMVMATRADTGANQLRWPCGCRRWVLPDGGKMEPVTAKQAFVGRYSPSVTPRNVRVATRPEGWLDD